MDDIYSIFLELETHWQKEFDIIAINSNALIKTEKELDFESMFWAKRKMIKHFCVFKQSYFIFYRDKKKLIRMIAYISLI